jgi:hypothetical protein
MAISFARRGESFDFAEVCSGFLFDFPAKGSQWTLPSYDRNQTGRNEIKSVCCQ